ncbi:tyrosine-type recombinase/integrase [Aporhodopirellula aestuarii]|uniref:Tyrosine-type recombinase/integrase n=1 Tax=Aporhodopirellula aestuarii TaxID=2950107 RepID=A0ABT0U2C8_9BACT|nr:tyrosine-type recombinase/integrase [Aporhodopirellula aestuarii]MCM2371062.1 tyrosine-type recombinase/integrase [Aporhodopirellula aestuarii]
MKLSKTENQSSCVSQNAIAKSKIIAQIAKIVRRHGLDYEDWRYVTKAVRQKCELTPKKKGRKLPKVLTQDEFKRFYEVVDRASDVQHSLMLRLLFQTAVRNSELCGIQVADVDLANSKIRINDGKGSKDRYVLFGKSFATALRTHMAAHPSNRWLFQTRRNSKYTTRRLQQIVKQYAIEAGVTATPHTFRHQAITWLTRHSGMADAELQILTGHARRETLSVYQHVALDEELEAKYQEAMKKTDL